MGKNTPVLMIGLDATEVTLIEKLCSEKKLPALQSLIGRGVFGHLASEARLFTGGVWPTFYTSSHVPWHGLYHNKLWRYEAMRCQVPDQEWFTIQPFWERLNTNKHRIALIDVPMIFETFQSDKGIHIAGWGTHDQFNRGAWPPDLWQKLRKNFGTPPLSSEFFGPQNAKSLVKLRENILAATDQLANISSSIYEKEAWDLFFVVFGGPHRGGHYLWELSQIDKETVSPATVALLERSMTDIYQACDRALAQLLEKASPDTVTLVFAVHGMGPNQGWSDLCPQMLSAIQQGRSGKKSKEGFLYKLKQVLPWSLMREVTTRLPERVSNRLVELWSSRMFDWSTTRYFPLPMDHAGYIRINLKGREPQGIVEPGEEYRALCKEIEEALLSFRNIGSGEPIVERVIRAEELAPHDARAFQRLPDLLVTWRTSATNSKGIVSEKYGTIPFEHKGKLPSGRSGNHRDRGWFVAAGKGIPEGITVEGYHIADLAPTLFHWLGAEIPREFQGKPIPELLHGPTE